MRRQKLAEWLPFACALSAVGCFLAGKPFLAGGLFVCAGLIRAVCGLPFATLIGVIGLAPVAVAVAPENPVLAVAATAIMCSVAGANVRELARLKKEGLYSDARDRGELSILLREHDMAHRLCRWVRGVGVRRKKCKEGPSSRSRERARPDDRGK